MAKEKRSVMTSLRLTPDEFERLEKLAKKEEKTKAAIIASLVNEAYEKSFPLDVEGLSESEKDELLKRLLAEKK